MAFDRVIFSQHDPRWKDKFLGFSEKFTIGSDGCVVSCLAIVAAGFGYQTNPDEVNELLKEKNGFANLILPGGSKEKILVVWGSFDQRYNQVVCKALWSVKNNPIPFNRLDEGLTDGRVAVVQVDRDPVKEGIQSHFVVVYGKKNDDYLILDPLPFPSDQQDVTLIGRYSKGRPLSEFVPCVLMYQGPNFTPSETLSDKHLLRVRVKPSVTRGLYLRSMPEMNENNVIVLEKAGTVLHIVEPAQEAVLKIGVEGQWLQVSDPYGRNGYVFAQYVELIGRQLILPGGELPAEILYVMVPLFRTEGLNLRSEPVRSPTTIIKILTAGTRLLVFEPVDAALTKIGKAGQWLSVVDPDGRIGYVWAEYVERTDNSQPGEEIIPENEGENEGLLRVRVRSTALKLRSSAIATSKDNILAYEATMTILLVLEPLPDALPKIGVKGEWLHVKDPFGREGFVGAFFVELTVPPGDL